MDVGQIIALIALCITVVGGLIWLIFTTGKTYARLERVEGDIGKIKEKVELIPTLTFRVDTLWSRVVVDSKSPRQLNDYGKKVLVESGIGAIVDAHYESILSTVKSANPQNAYQTEERVIEVVGRLRDEKEILPLLEKGAFQVGLDLDMILLVGAIHVRDRIIKELGFKIEDLDKRPD